MNCGCMKGRDRSGAIEGLTGDLSILYRIYNSENQIRYKGSWGKVCKASMIA